MDGRPIRETYTSNGEFQVPFEYTHTYMQVCIHTW